MKNTLVSFFIFFFCCSQAQVEKNSDLYKALRQQDSIFFELAFNQCNLAFAEGLVHKDLTFFHDQAGIQDREKFFEAFRQNICPQQGPKPIRVLEKESIEVFPLSSNGSLYGALITGRHSFYLREPGKEDRFTSRARFSNIYLLEHKRWLLREVISYDHEEN